MDNYYNGNQSSLGVVSLGWNMASKLRHIKILVEIDKKVNAEDSSEFLIAFYRTKQM